MRYFFTAICCLFLTEGAAQQNALSGLLDSKQYAKVIMFAESSGAVDSADYQAMYVIGQAYEGLLKYKDAYKYFRHCLSFDTLNIDILNTLGRTAINLGKATEAQQYFHRVLLNDSADFYANYQLARLYQQSGDYGKAIDKYRQLLQNDPENTTLLRNIGDCYIRMDVLPGAIIYYFQAYSYNRENAGLANTLINTMLRASGEYAGEALALCDTALYYNPENDALKRTKGMALFMKGAYTEANDIYTGLMLRGDSSLHTMKYGGASRYYAGLYMDAIEPLERAYTMDSTSVDATILYGAVLGRTYDRKRAYQLYNYADTLMLPNPSLSNQLLQSRAETLARDGKVYEASNLFYEIWQRTGRLDMLSRAATHRSQATVSGYKTPSERQKGLYLQIAYLREYISQEKEMDKLAVNHRSLLESVYEDMFFRSITEEPLLSPSGERSTINVVDLRSMINRLPETMGEARSEWERNQERLRNQGGVNTDSLAGKNK